MEAETTERFLDVNTSMRAAIDTYDWSATPLGPRESWPQTLRTILSLILDTPFAMLIMWGEDLIQIYNQGYVPIFGDRHPSALGQPAAECWASIWDEVGPLLRGVYERGEAVYFENLPLEMQRGGRPETAYFTFSYSPVRDGDRIGGLICVVTETTAHVLREREAAERAEALAQLDRAKTQFFSNVSHEFRTPLTLMLGPLEDLVRTLPEYEDRERADLARRNAIRLQKLVNMLLDFSAAQSGMVRAQRSLVDVDALTTDLASEFRSAHERAGLYLHVETQAGRDVPLDRAMYEKVVLNLLSNALKFTFEGGVTVCTRIEGDRFELSVSDTGIGIAKEDLGSLFQRFSRVQSARSRTHEGSGIGLALVHELVSLHHGSISVESEPRCGTTFTVCFPVNASVDSARAVTSGMREYRRQFREEADAYTRGETPQAAPETGAPKIVIADDNADLRSYLGRMLGARYDVTLVSNGRELVDTVRDVCPDLVVADVMMPDIDGFEALRLIRNDQACASTPVILLSARAGDEAAAEGLARGADDYIVKPFVAADLTARIDALLRRSARGVQGAHFERERRENAILSRAADRFIAASDTGGVLNGIADVLSPAFAEWCVVYVRSADEKIRAAAIAHPDPAKVELGRTVDERFPYDPDDNAAPARVMRMGKTQFYEIFGAEYTASLRSRERGAIVQALRITSAVFFPLVVDGETVAVVSVSRETQRFDEADVQFLERFGKRASLAYQNARAQERERTIASTLQRALLPAALPAVGGLSFSASYTPAAQEHLVGGDWYDAFAVDHQHVVITIGDVVGHGLEAATVMAGLRQALRGFALYRKDPGEMLEALNRFLIAEYRGRLATAYVAVVDAQTLETRVASAGHYGALAANADGKLRTLSAEGLLLGVDERAAYESVPYDVEPGELLALFTDGYIENERDIEAGEARFAQSLLDAYGTADPAASIHLAMFAKKMPHDDAALIVVDTNPTLPSLSLSLPALPLSAFRARTALRRFTASLPIVDERRADLVFAAGEAVVNAIEHAYPRKPSGEMHITGSFDGMIAVIEVADDGGGWDDEDIDDIQRGYGLPLMHALADNVDIQRTAAGTRVRITTATTYPSHH